jgi:hypothetical protein
MPLSYATYRQQVLNALEAKGYELDSWTEFDDEIEDGWDDETTVHELVERILNF